MSNGPVYSQLNTAEMKHLIPVLFWAMHFPVQAQSCPEELSLTSPLFSVTTIERATGHLTSISRIEGGRVDYRAGGSVQLTHGFEALPGSVFEAAIAPCEIGAPAGDDLSLSLEAYPNPFARSLTMEYTLSEPGPVNGYISDLRGVVVIRLVSEPSHPPGTHRLSADLAGLAQGAYVLTLDTSRGRKSLTIVKGR